MRRRPLTGVQLKSILKWNTYRRLRWEICQTPYAYQHARFWLLGQTFVAVQDAVRRNIFGEPETYTRAAFPRWAGVIVKAMPTSPFDPSRKFALAEQQPAML